MGKIAGIIRELNEFDWRELGEPAGMGDWPASVQACLLLLLAMALFGSAYFLALRGLQQREGGLETEAAGLRTELQRLTTGAAELDRYREWARQNEAPYMRMLRQLPYESETPALMDEVSALGLVRGLEFKSIELPDEREARHYVEQPMEIRLTGAYHDIGAFLGGLASLDRIVSSHDFSLTVASEGGLELVLEARSYRYRPLSDAEAGAAGENPDFNTPFETHQIAPFRYLADSERNPFRKSPDAEAGQGHSWPLAEYGLHELQFVGLLRQGQRPSGLIRDPEGKVHRVRPGDDLGRNRSRIRRISELGVLLLGSGRGDNGTDQSREILLAREEDR